MSTNKLYILLAFVFLSFSITAQPVAVSSYETMLKTADEAAKNNDYVNAIEWFEKAYKESKDQNLQVAIADMYMLLRDYPRAEKIYERVIKKDRNEVFFDIKLDYARALKYQGNYKQALDEFNNFALTTESDSLRKEAKIEMKGIIDLEKYPENIEAAVSFANEFINSPSAEASPAFYEDGSLYFASLNTKLPVVLDGEEGEYHTKIYTTSKDPKGEYLKASPLDESINRLQYHTSGNSFSADGKKMYFTRAKLLNNGIATSEIYVSQRNGDKWSPPNPIDALNNEFRSRHPYEGELFGNKVLYYVSDMPGGFGGYDLYYSTISGDSYGTPVNLGPIINTARTEEYPFFKDGTLYFSSNGQPGMGGKDIFYSTWNGTNWATPTNMGYNYNSSYDDTALRFNQSGNAAALVSNRIHKDKKKFKNTATCCDDIYLIQIRDIVVDIQLTVEGDKGPLEGATAELLEGLKYNSIDSKTNFLSNKFSFLLDPDKNYKVYITREGFYPDSIVFNTNGIFDDYSFKKNVVLKPKPIEEDIDTYNMNEPIRLNNIYYDYDDDKILADAEKDLDYLRELMEQYPDMIIELSSHTDSRGESKYNQQLSQRRAESAKKWLINEGITAQRVKTVGYGESVLLNRCKNGVRCSEDEHRINRRTEFKIIAGPQTIQVKKSRLKGSGKG